MSPAIKTFRVRYVRLGETAVHDETLQGADENAVRSQLVQGGQVVLSVKEQRMVTTGTIKRGAYVLFCKEIRTLLRAGMTVVEAVDTLSARERIEVSTAAQVRTGAKAVNLSGLLLQRLQRGLALSVALAELPQTPPVLVAAVRTGERTSNLVEALDDYLRFDELVSKLRSKVVSAAIYPALVSGVGLAISVFLLLVVMPNFASMYESVRTGASAGASSSAAFTVEATHFIGKNRLGVVLSLVAFALVVAVWITSGTAARHVARLAHAVPWIRGHMRDFQLAMMYQAIALLIKGGYAMTEAMQVAAQSALSPEVADSLSQARARVVRGGLVSQALSQAQLCDEVGRRLMAAAERNGESHQAADVVSQMYAERFELFVQRLTRIVEPVLLLLVALVVGGIVILMYMPVFDMATQLL